MHPDRPKRSYNNDKLTLHYLLIFNRNTSKNSDVDDILFYCVTVSGSTGFLARRSGPALDLGSWSGQYLNLLYWYHLFIIWYVPPGTSLHRTYLHIILVSHRYAADRCTTASTKHASQAGSKLLHHVSRLQATSSQRVRNASGRKHSGSFRFDNLHTGSRSIHR